MKIKNAQEIQDSIFRKMSAWEKIRLMSNFFLLGKKLEKLKYQNDSRRSSLQNSKNTEKS